MVSARTALLLVLRDGPGYGRDLIRRIQRATAGRDRFAEGSVYPALRGLEAARLGDIFVTVTGDIHVLRAEHFAVMKDGAVLANAGHFDVEIDLAALEAAAQGRRRIRPNLEEWRLADGRCLYVAAEGRLVNLAAAEGHPADVMDMSFADQALAAEWLGANAGKLEPRVYRLPEYLDAEVARIKLESLGGGLDTLTPEQERYLRSWEMGT